MQARGRLLRHRQTGFSHVVGVGCLLVLTVSGIVLYINNELENRNKEAIAQEVSNTHKFIAETMAQWTQPDFSGVSMDALRQRGIFPPTMVVGTEIRNTARGLVTVAPVSVSSSLDSLSFTEQGFSKVMCEGVLSGIEKGVRAVLVNGQVVKPLDGTLNTDLLTSNCLDRANTITFLISK